MLLVIKNEIYDKLEEKYRLVGDAHFREVLETLMTPEEGKLVLELSTPMTPVELAGKLNMDEKTLAQKMDNLSRRGLLFRGKEQYMAWRDAHQLNARVMFCADEYIPPKFLELRKTDQRYSESPYAEINNFVKIYERTGKPLVRVIPDRLAILASPKIKPEQVLWYEDMAELLKRAEIIGVVDCDCRRIYQRCDKPLQTCLHFGKNIIEYEKGRGGRMRIISYKEALELSDIAERAGLVHETPGNNASLSGVICNCCTDCFSTFEPAIHDGKLRQVADPSRYRAIIDLDLCKGCQTCVERCLFDAIEMVPVPNSKKKKAQIDAEKCMGCGACLLGCQAKALTFELVRPPDFIPPKPASPVGMMNLK
jgi:Pyruvate/2-oxoacid:ferredoxin oxidoreductase delta subunit